MLFFGMGIIKIQYRKIILPIILYIINVNNKTMFALRGIVN